MTGFLYAIAFDNGVTARRFPLAVLDLHQDSLSIQAYPALSQGAGGIDNVMDGER